MSARVTEPAVHNLNDPMLVERMNNTNKFLETIFPKDIAAIIGDYYGIPAYISL